NIKHTIGSRSILIISHRVSSVKLADKIIVLDNGTVMESGTHDELIQLGKTYAHIYQQQLQEPINT
nr:ABC transporter [Cytophagaceae bacterium]